MAFWPTNLYGLITVVKNVKAFLPQSFYYENICLSHIPYGSHQRKFI